MRQYHEGKKRRKQTTDQSFKPESEYFLGHFVAETTLDDTARANAGATDDDADAIPLPEVDYDGEMHPYHSVLYRDGTTCDLSGQTRTTEVRYICLAGSPHALVSIDEVSTCNYLAVIATNALCQNVRYQVRKTPVHEMLCRAVGVRSASDPPQPASMPVSQFSWLGRHYAHEQSKADNAAKEATKKVREPFYMCMCFRMQLSCVGKGECTQGECKAAAQDNDRGGRSDAQAEGSTGTTCTECGACAAAATTAGQDPPSAATAESEATREGSTTTTATTTTATTTTGSEEGRRRKSRPIDAAAPGATGRGWVRAWGDTLVDHTGGIQHVHRQVHSRGTS